MSKLKEAFDAYRNWLKQTGRGMGSDEFIALEEQIAIATAPTLAKDNNDKWIPFGRIKVDIENETETFERYDPKAATAAADGLRERIRAALIDDESLSIHAAPDVEQYCLLMEAALDRIADIAARVAQERAGGGIDKTKLCKWLNSTSDHLRVYAQRPDLDSDYASDADSKSTGYRSLLQMISNGDFDQPAPVSEDDRLFNLLITSVKQAVDDFDLVDSESISRSYRYGRQLCESMVIVKAALLAIETRQIAAAMTKEDHGN
jgi:hypothetical protein